MPDQVENLGWTVFTFGVSTVPYVQGAYAPGYDDEIIKPASTDIFADAVKFLVADDPKIPRFTLVQVTGGGLTATRMLNASEG